jgi:OOP family OmpA-OmpF porin
LSSLQGVIVKKSTHIFPALALAAAALAGSVSAQTQTSSASWYAPSTTYIGFNAGHSHYRGGCGTGAFSCDEKDNAYSIYGGGMFNNNVGFELGYIDMGRIERAGGNTKAHGFNVSLLGRVPVNQTLGFFGKVGTTYGRTSVSSAAGSGVTAGSESGFGLSLGAGLSFDFNDKWSAVLQWERHDFKFSGTGRDNVDATSVGLKYRF